MNTTMADGAEQRLDAQIAEALFGQPGMSKMDVANRVRELRGDGPALLVDMQPGGTVRLGNGWSGWGTQYPNKMPKLYGAREIAELNHYPEEGQRLIFLAENPVHVGHLVDAARVALPFVAFAYSKGVDGAEEAGRAIEAALSAQPSPGGQGDAREREGWRNMQKVAASQTRKDGVGACDALYELAVKHGANDAEAAGFAHHVNGSLALLETQTHDGLHREATMEAALAARQPVELIAKKVGDYRVTVAEDAITVSHGRDIVFAYSARDPEPINARQPVGEEENVAADTYWTVAGMIEPHIQDGALPASVHDSVSILLEHWLKTRQPVGELHLPPDGYYKIVYDDAEVPDESFARTGALEAALRRFEQISARWNAHLFVRFANNTRDCTVPNAEPAQAVDLGQSIPWELTPVAAALKRFDECAEDCGSEGCDIGRAWFDALTTMGLLKRTQRSPAVWTMTAEGERLLALIDGKAVGK